MVGHHRHVKFGVLLALGYCAGGRANLENYSNCTSYYIDYIGDGFCQLWLDNNNEACGWDGGDCCECTCVVNPSRDYSCTTWSFDCLDPNSGCPSSNVLEYVNCTSMYVNSIGDGSCDYQNNNEACGWDGGDCCECTCVSESSSGCDTESFVCLDPTSGCTDPSLAEHVDCGGNLASFSDGNCDSMNNNEACGWDGGDCCECTCNDGSYYNRESSEFFCKDPDSLCVDPIVIEYESCDGDLSLYGDGWCHSENNNEACGWDGGDCCECTCDGHGCSILEGDTKCEDPEAAGGALGCMDWPSYPLPCSLEVHHKWEVKDSQQAQSLAEALNCSGGRFEVEWYGNIVVKQTLALLGGTVLNVTGVGSGARMDGGGTTGLFIVINSSLHLSNIVLTNGKSTLGGAIAALGSRVILNHTSFIGNTAKHNGGALFVAEGSNLTSGNETYFTNNRAERQGGAVCARERTHTTWTDGAVFFNNSAGGEGGAMALSFGSSALWAGAGGVNVSNNTANYNGGGLYIIWGSSSTWEGEAMFEGNTVGTNGGGLYVYEGVLLWQGTSNFQGNTAGSAGGGLYVLEGELLWQGISNIEGNTALVGGGLYIFYSNASWSRASSYFHYNFAGFGGGALFASHSNVSWAGEATFSSNNVTCYGGALYLSHDTTASWLASASFVDNYAGYSGGVLYIRYDSTASWLASANFVDNYAGYNGGVLYIRYDSTASWLASANFVDNYSGYDGGVFWISQGSTAVWMGDTTFANNSARYVGGALSVSLSSTIFWAGNMTFSNNTAGDNGGVLYVKGTASWKGDTSFINNSAYSGGALFVALGSTVTWTAETNFISNQAQQDDGAISFSTILSSEESSTTVNVWGRTNFAYNKCGWSGGAMSLSGEVTLSSNATVIFLGNLADVYGGAVYISSVGVGPEFYGARFYYNHAQIGGGVYAVTGGTTETKTPYKNIIEHPTKFFSCSFINNTADTSGGGVSTASGKDDFVNTAFVGNVARTGGALQLSGTASITSCLFEDNIAESGGGPAVLNIGYISEANTISFLKNGLKCENGTFFKFSEGNDEELWEVVCEGCLVTCDNCTFEEPITVPECISLSDAGIEHATSSGGDTTIEKLKINKGYWRATATSTQVLKCYNGDACRGGVTGEKDFCSDGYEGAYCSVCSTGYIANLNFRCTPCTGLKWGIAIASIASGVILAIGIVVVLYLSSAGMRGSRRSIVDRVARFVPFQSLKIIIVAWQIVTQFASVANVTFPDIYQRFLDAIDVLNFELSWILSVGCVFSFDFHDQLLISTTMPIAGMILLGITYVTAAGRHRHTKAALRIIRHKHVSMVLLITFLIYSSVSSTVFQMFACEDLDDGKSYLRADYRIECDSAKHKTLQIYSVFMIMLYPVGIPCLYAGLLFKYRNVLNRAADRDVSSGVDSISDLWKPYKPSHFYYEVIECVRRISLTGAVVFIYPNSAAQIAVTLVMAFVFTIISEGLAPYDSRWDCWINRTGHVIVFMSMYIALLLKVKVSSERASSQELLASIIVAAHTCMVLAVVVEAVAMACSTTKPQSRDEPRPRVSYRLPSRHPKRGGFKIHGVSTFDGIEMRSCSTAESESKSHD